MHRFRNKRSVRRLKLAGLSFLITILLAISLPLVGGYAIFTKLPVMLWYFLGILGCLIFFGLYYRLTAANCRCPLCHGTMLLPRPTGSNRKARKTLGSYRMTVIFQSLFLNRVRCTYCGEPCACKEREHNPSMKA